MKIESIPQALEQTATGPSSAEIAKTLEDAHQIVYKIASDPTFHGVCMDRSIDPYEDMGKPQYWSAFADHAHAAVERARQKGGDPLRLSAIDLVTATPIAVLDEAMLESASAHTDRRALKEISTYNEKLRNFAEDFPETHVSDVSRVLTNITNMTIEKPTTRWAASRLLKTHLRGAQHELAFGQILEQTGRNFTPATLTDDLHGVDYIVSGKDGHQLYIDVKASLSDIEQAGSHGAYAQRSNGNVVMYSLTQDQEFGDTFFISDESASAKAPVLDELLSHAEAGRRIA